MKPWYQSKTLALQLIPIAIAALEAWDAGKATKQVLILVAIALMNVVMRLATGDQLTLTKKG